MFIKEKLDLIGKLKKKIFEAHDEIRNLQIDNANLQGQVYSLNYSFNRLQEENQKLIDWIEKIINDLGAYEVSENNDIRVPFYKKRRDEKDEERNVEEIILPQITYTIVKKQIKGEKYEKKWI